MSAHLLHAVSIPPPPKLRSLNHGCDNTQTPAALSTQKPKQIRWHMEAELSILGKAVNSTTYASILDACRCSNLGRQVHAHAVKCGFCGNEFVDTKMLQMYGRCGCLEDAVKMFDGTPMRNLYSWTAIMNVHLEHELFEYAASLFLNLLREGSMLEFFVFPVALKISCGIGDLEMGRQLHGMVIKSHIVSNLYVGNALIDMYGKGGSLEDAKKVFITIEGRDCVSWNSIITACIANGMVYEGLGYLDEMVSPNLVSWSAMIGGFSQNGYDEEALHLLQRMLGSGLRPNARTLASILPSCARLQNITMGKEIHGYVTRHLFMSNAYVVNGLVDVYRRCSDMKTADKLFSRFSVRNEVAYNTMIVGYCENGDVSKAKEVFDNMDLESWGQGNPNSTPQLKGIISWNSMISGFVDNGLFNEALSMYRHLLDKERPVPDSFTLGSVLTACANLTSLRKGKEVHCQAIVRGLESNPFVGGALVELYGKCQDFTAARSSFDRVNERDIATWNSLISAYSRQKTSSVAQTVVDTLICEMKDDGFDPNVYTWNSVLAGFMETDNHETALNLFRQMDVKPDIFTVGIITTSCSKLASAERGNQVHAYSIRHGYESTVHIGSALVDMYAKCGNIKNAVLSYNRIRNPNLVAHNVMLTAYAMHGLGEEGIALLRRISEEPDHITFLSALSCCVHVGEVELGRELFNLMAYYGINPSLKHYTCMVDLLSRGGRLDEAHELISEMPMNPDAVVWGALLGGCVIRGNVELGEIAADKIIEMEPENTGNYVMLANLYAFAGKWDDLARVRTVMKDRGMHKNPGCSWIEDRDEVHVFLASDRSHEKTEEIYVALEKLTEHMKSLNGLNTN